MVKALFLEGDKMFEMPKISTDELKEKLVNHDDLALLDVREVDEYQAGHIKEAENVPLGTVQKYQGDKTKPLYVICRSGRRSEQAAQLLSLKGYDVKNVAGGMLNWHGKTTKE